MKKTSTLRQKIAVASVLAFAGLMLSSSIVPTVMAQSGPSSGRNSTIFVPANHADANGASRPSSGKTFGPGCCPSKTFGINSKNVAANAPGSELKRGDRKGGSVNFHANSEPGPTLGEAFVNKPFIPAFGHSGGSSGRTVTSSHAPFAGRSYNQGGSVLTTLPSHASIPYHPTSFAHPYIPYSASRNINPYGR